MKAIKKNFVKYLWFWPLLVGLILRLYKLTASSIWHDEGYTMWLLRYDFAGILERTARDVHPPGYYLLAKPWVSIFGNSVFSIRFLSVLFSLGIVYLVYLIVKEIWNKEAAFVSSMIVAVSPFMVRFAQEARMYGVVAFFTTLATWFFIKWIKERKLKWLYLYIPAMLIAMYTQYYAFFVIISHWAIMLVYTKDVLKFRWLELVKEKVGVFDFRWWLANGVLLAGYAVWFPVAYRQVTRITGNYWIQPEWITWRTVPNNVLQFATYTHFDAVFNSNGILGKIVYIIVISAAIFGGAYLFKNKEKIKVVASMYIFGFLPMLLVYTLSEIRQPIYQDRYFPFSAVAIFAIWGTCIATLKNRYLKYRVIVITFGALLVGNYIMHASVNHKMKEAVNSVKTQKQEGDLVISGELYTFLDSSYYFDYEGIRWMGEPVEGYGETSLFYDQGEKYMISEDEVFGENRVWVIGKTGDKEYWDDDLWRDYRSVTYFEEAGKDNGLRATLYIKN
ncbi:MAG: glycosyltransferase family 39 protein [Patescibacteria group bacterium]|nr:glycosyltransferase family 39 protein [Patescibacteria group bacterium]